MGFLKSSITTIVVLSLVAALCISTVTARAADSVAVQQLASVFRVDQDKAILIGYSPKHSEMIQNSDWNAFISFWRPLEDGAISRAEVPDNALKCSKTSSRFVKNNPTLGFICQFDLSAEQRHDLAAWHLWRLEYHFVSGSYEYNERLHMILSAGLPSIFMERRIITTSWGSEMQLNLTVARPALAVHHKMDPSQYQLKTEFFCDLSPIPDEIIARCGPFVKQGADALVFQYTLRSNDYEGKAGCSMNLQTHLSGPADVQTNEEPQKFRLDVTWQSHSYSERFFGLDTSDSGILWNLAFLGGLVIASVAVVTIWDCISECFLVCCCTSDEELMRYAGSHDVELASTHSPQQQPQQHQAVIYVVPYMGYQPSNQQQQQV